MRERGGRLAAFTLVELTVTVTVLAILSIAAVSLLTGIPSSKLTAVQVRVASAIRYAQELAMTRHTVHGVYFDVAANRFTVFENGNTSDPASDPATSTDFIVQLGTGKTAGVTVQSVSFGGSPKISFTPDGAPASGGSVVLAHPSVGTRTVTVLAQTGVVTP
ncbi:MAG: GspH/FimT family pseudopilin [Planctomycetes bacterium]|nr:GspH/FimT family pseudopilin [Planctomycetota bacterium]MBI3847962.1 GspH/FimT family pseudopilin [Planctomycetota bacterium]